MYDQLGDAIRVLVLIGTRPEAIKLSPVVRLLRSDQRYSVVVCTTGQHGGVLTASMAALDITADIVLREHPANQTLSELVGKLIQTTSAVIRSVRPHWVVVQGDTATAWAGALASFYECIPVAHVEAGLRTWNIEAPFPEEFHRQLLGRIASLNFAPTNLAAANLARDGIAAERILITGNTVVDAANWVTSHPRFVLTKPPSIPGTKRILLTSHRRKLSASSFRAICSTLLSSAARHAANLTYITHHHPGRKEAFYSAIKELDLDPTRLQVLAPLPHEQFLHMLMNSDLVVTDSGGVQEEATIFGIPTVIIRELTDRPESVVQGVVKMVGTNPSLLASAVDDILSARDSNAPPTRSPFGDGRAAERIVEWLAKASGKEWRRIEAF